MRSIKSRSVLGVIMLIILIGCRPTRSIVSPPTVMPGPSPHPRATVSATLFPTITPAIEPPPSSRTTFLPNFSHIFIIILENRESSAVVGNPAAPYLNGLAAQYARATNYYAISHPSLPNYLALMGGDTFGITSDCNDCFVSAPSVVDQLEAAGRTWKAYMESMPQPCFLGDASAYKQKHNPFIYFDSIRTNPDRCRQIVPLTQFDLDLRLGTVPSFVWITPNLCHDMHDCNLTVGDQWLKDWVPKILASPAWQANGVLFITFDEGSSRKGCCTYAAGGQVDMIVIAPTVRPGFSSDVEYDHYSLLRSIEEAWGLPLLSNANCACSKSMAEFFAVP